MNARSKITIHLSNRSLKHKNSKPINQQKLILHLKRKKFQSQPVCLKWKKIKKN